MRPACLLLALLPAVVWAESGGRPDGVSIANFQFGPHNRWAFSHIREVLTTANIAHDPTRTLALPRSDEYNAELTVEFQGRRQSIAEIAKQQYVLPYFVVGIGQWRGRCFGIRHSWTVSAYRASGGQAGLGWQHIMTLASSLVEELRD